MSSEIYTLTSAKRIGICVRVCSEQAAAQDALHDLYLTIWKPAGTWQPSRSSPITRLSIPKPGPALGGLSYSELARRSNVPLSTMKSRVPRGLAQLKLQLDA